MKSKGIKYIYEILGVILSLIIAAPLYLILINSFKNVTEAADAKLSMPTEWNIIENYTKVISEANLLSAFKNSVIVTVFSVIIIIVLCSISGFIIQRRNDSFCKFLEQAMLGGIILPLSIVTTYILMHSLKMTGTYWGVILLYVATAFPFSTYIFTGYFSNIPREIDESAVLDGCGGLRLFFGIIFPLIKPAVATTIILNFIGVWGDFGIAIYFFNNATRYTLTLTAYFFSGIHSADWNLVFADLVMISLPVIIFYLFLQKYIVSGLTAGSIKG